MFFSVIISELVANAKKANAMWVFLPPIHEFNFRFYVFFVIISELVANVKKASAVWWGVKSTLK